MSEVAEEPGTETETEPDESPDVPDEQEDEDEDAEAPVDDSQPQEQASARQPEQAAADPEDPRSIEGQKKWKTFEAAIRKIWGPYEQNLLPCPLCFDYHKGLIDLNDRGQYPEEVLTALTEFVRGSEQAQLQLATHVRQCSTCGGYGVLLSGSKVGGKDRVKCPTCKGNGFQGSGEMPGAPEPQNGQVEVEYPADAQAMVQDDVDAWGSPRLLDDGQENPNYGRAPSYKNPSLP